VYRKVDSGGGEVLHIIFVTLMTINDVNLYVVFRGISGLNP
jgi:hypothetical protein